MAQRRAKGEGGLFKVKGSRFWRAQYTNHDGKVIRVSTKESVKAKARLLLQRWMSDAVRGLPPLPDAHKIRYADLRRGLIAAYIAKGNRSLTTTANGDETINGLKQLDEFFGYPANDGPAVMQITTDKANDFAKKRLADGVGNAMVNRSLSCLRRMLYVAHEDNKIQFVPKIRLLKEPPARRGFVEQKKFDELIALLPTHLRPLVTLLYYCGVRVNEARQIEWTQVDLDKGLIGLEEEQTKTDEPRVIPLPSILIMRLREVKPKTGKVFSDTNLRVEWEKACDACKLGKRTKMEPEKEGGFVWYKYKGLLLHDLRRSAVRNLRIAGNDETVIMKISGHATAEVFRRYNIVSTDDVTEAMRRLELSSDRSVTVTAKSPKRLSASNSKQKTGA
jgi:integrase